MAGFLFGAAGMFATMYSTQAILPVLGRDFGVSPSRAGLTISALPVIGIYLVFQRYLVRGIAVGALK